jgi:TonB family protein
VQEASTQPQQQALAETNPPQSNPQAPTTTPSNPESNPESEPELVSGLRPEVWARQQELRQEFLARQAAANQGESQSQETVTRQQPASAAPQQTTTEPNSQSVSEVTEPEVQQPAVAETPKPEAELSYHQKQMLAYHQELVEQNRLQAQGGSLSEEQEAMLAGAEEFYTWFMQLRQDWPDLTTKTPSSIADNYPLAACPEKLAGRAVVGTVVNPNGEILESPKVLRGSGSEILDNEALNYVESVQFPTHEQPTAYQYSFEFNYDREACAIAQPDDSSQSPHNHSEAMTEDSQTIEGEAGEGINSPAAIEAMEDSGQPKPTEFPHSDDNQSETEAFTPQVQSSQPIVEGEAGEGINSLPQLKQWKILGSRSPLNFPTVMTINRKQRLSRLKSSHHQQRQKPLQHPVRTIYKRNLSEAIVGITLLPQFQYPPLKIDRSIDLSNGSQGQRSLLKNKGTGGGSVGSVLVNGQGSVRVNEC